MLLCKGNVVLLTNILPSILQEAALGFIVEMLCPLAPVHLQNVRMVYSES